MEVLLKQLNNFFDSNIRVMLENIVNDNCLIENIPDVNKFKNNIINIDSEEGKSIADSIFNFINNITDNDKIIDFVYILYLNGKFGVPNSIENIGRLKDNCDKFNILQNHNKNYDKKNVKKSLIYNKDNGFLSLKDLEDFIIVSRY